MSRSKLKEGDLVVAVGATLTHKGPSERHRIMAHIIATGKYDVFAQEEGSNRVFKISGNRCLKVNDGDVDSTAEVTVPKLGDLVLSISERFGKVEKKMGVLMEIVDVPGRSMMVKLMNGDKSETALFDNLIVLE
jgi:hypothetical protein